MSETPLKVEGFDASSDFRQIFNDKLQIPLVLSRHLTLTEQRQAKKHGLEFARENTYTLSVKDEREILAAIEGVNEKLAALEAAAAAIVKRERAEQAEAEKERETEQDRIRKALEAAGLGPVDPKPGKPTQRW